VTGAPLLDNRTPAVGGGATRFVFILQTLPRLLPRLNPAQHRLLQRHVDRAVEALEEGDRLIGGVVNDLVEDALAAVRGILLKIDTDAVPMVKFAINELPMPLVPYLESPFAQGLVFNQFCADKDLSHTKGTRAWEGGNAAVAARNLIFLPGVFGELWDAGLLDKTRLAAIANRNLTDEAYMELATMVRTRRKEDVDDRLLKMPATNLKIGRRGPEQALEAAARHGWIDRFREVEIAEDLVNEAELQTDDEDEEDNQADIALRTLRSGLSGAKVEGEVVENLKMSPDPIALVDKFLVAHRQTGEADPDHLTKTVFYAHAGPMQKLIADDKLLLRHFRPVKTQKRGQLFYKLLEVIEAKLMESQHAPDSTQRGITEREATATVRRVVNDLNSDPNRYLIIPDEWLGEVTRRHLYFGSRTRKEGAAYKWFRKIGFDYYLGAHKTQDEVDEKDARKAAKAAATE
jgi:hypothetical protein